MRSISRPFTTLNTAITARPVWYKRAIINSRDYPIRRGPDSVGDLLS